MVTIPEEQLNDYYLRSGDTELSDGKVEVNENGFCVWRKIDEAILLVHVYGNGTYWNQFASNKAKELGLSKVIFATKRNPDGFIYKHGFKVTGYILEREV
jgi:hypothetical protein